MTWSRAIGVAQASMVGTLGEPVTFALGAEVVEARGVVRNPPVVTEYGGASYRGQGPSVHVRMEDLPGWVVRDTGVHLRGKDWVVTDLIPDGEGMMELVLRCR